jgi:hypothetical protein
MALSLGHEGGVSGAQFNTSMCPRAIRPKAKPFAERQDQPF